MRSEKEKERRCNYKKTHKEQNRRHNKTFRTKHQAEIVEYNRLNPELRLRVPLAIYQALNERFTDVPEAIRGMITAAVRPVLLKST